MSARDRTVIVVLGVVAAVAAAWLLVIQPKRSELSNIQHQVSNEQSQLATAQSQLAAAQTARTQFRVSYAAMVRLGEAVPTDDNVGSLIYQVQAAANSASVDFQALSLASPGGGSSSTQNPLPPGVTVGPAGFPIEPFSFTFRGSFFHLADFFGRLQRFVTQNSRGLQVRGRLLTLNSIELGPGNGGFPQISATVSATAYLLPQTQGLVAGATPVGPSATTTQQASTATPAGGSSAAVPRPSQSSSAGPPAAVVVGGQP
jgi:type II secretory pathway pseudopilin PulG